MGGLRFRKRIGLEKLLRVNLSKSGVSLGIGPPGLNINVGPRGTRTTVGLPGTSLFWQEQRSWKRNAPLADASAIPPAQAGGDAVSTQSSLETPAEAPCMDAKILLLVASLILGVVMFLWYASDKGGAPVAPPRPQQPAADSLPDGGGIRSPVDPAAFEAPPKRADLAAPLTRTEIAELQTRLKAARFSPGPPDGIAGQGTRSAIRDFERSRSIPIHGEPTRELLDRLRGAK